MRRPWRIWTGAGPNDRAEALRELDRSKGVAGGFGVLAGALLVNPPQTAEIAALHKLWDSR